MSSSLKWVKYTAFNQAVPGSNPDTLIDAQIAQLVEQRTENPRVVGSIPTLGTQHLALILDGWVLFCFIVRFPSL